MPRPQKPLEPQSLEDATQTIGQLSQVIEMQQAEIERWRAKTDDLKAQIQELLECSGKHSGNSSRPPSSDSPAHRAKRRKQPRSTRQHGAQPGHKGHQRVLLDETDVDQIERHFPQATCACGGTVNIGAEPRCRHQVFDLPPVRYTVTEHQIFDGVCNRCARTLPGAWPRWVPSGQMGPGLIAWIVLMSAQFHLSIRQIQRLGTQDRHLKHTNNKSLSA